MNPENMTLANDMACFVSEVSLTHSYATSKKAHPCGLRVDDLFTLTEYSQFRGNKERLPMTTGVFSQ